MLNIALVLQKDTQGSQTSSIIIRVTLTYSLLFLVDSLLPYINLDLVQVQILIIQYMLGALIVEVLYPFNCITLIEELCALAREYQLQVCKEAILLKLTSLYNLFLYYCKRVALYKVMKGLVGKVLIVYLSLILIIAHFCIELYKQ